MATSTVTADTARFVRGDCQHQEPRFGVSVCGFSRDYRTFVRSDNFGVVTAMGVQTRHVGSRHDVDLAIFIH